MAAMKTSTLPAVLKEYLPEYEPTPRGRPGKVRPEQVDNGGTKSTGEKSAGDGQDGEPRKVDSDQHQGKGRKSAKPRPATREKTSEILRKQDIEKYQRNYQNWQQIKVDVKEEGRDRGLQRIKLQHELIKAQDELYQENLQKREDELAKKREAGKAAKKAKAEELQKIGKGSFQDGGKSHGPTRPRRRTQTETSVITESDTTRDDIFVPEHAQTESQVSLASSSNVQAASGYSLGYATSPASALEEEEEPEEAEEEEDDDKGGNEPPSGSSHLPWHHEQLYSLYGKQADYFLYPKFEPEKKKAVGPMNPKLRKEGGCVGAGLLWNVLRKDSKNKLLNVDRRIPLELKSAYSAFVRQSLQHKRKPVKRNFYAQDDVPEMERLLDQSRVHGAQDYRRKVEIMFRSSHINEDRSNIMMFDNPIPDMNNLGGEESCGRYMPSWMDENWDEESELSYKKWVHGDSEKLRTLSIGASDSKENYRPIVRDPSGHLKIASGSEWDFMLVKKDGKKKSEDKLPKIQFLTEKAATCKGEFSKRRKEALESMHRPKQFEGNSMTFKAQSAMAMLGGQERGRTLQEGSPRSHSEMTQTMYASTWQPLSMGALAEYKPRKDVIGDGEFGHGQPDVWKSGIRT